ncbi:hypothetical protein [Enterococcus sp. BWT-B8]|uniref:hypothetical protein n=1 Tax=Enterococcus sp. BWT-B8 TaxID=2885157 RepID=UPI00226CEE96
MKRFNVKKGIKRTLAGIALVRVGGIASAIPVSVNAETTFPQNVTIEYSNNQLYRMQGKFENEEQYDRLDAPLFAVYNGMRQPVFCYEPTVNIVNEVTPNYTSNPLPDIAINNVPNIFQHYGQKLAQMLIRK